MKKIIVSILTIICLLSVAPLSINGKGAADVKQSDVNESVVHFFDGNIEYIISVAGSSIQLCNTKPDGGDEENLKPGWPVELDNHHGSAWSLDSSVTVSDLNQDGDFEVLIHSGEGVTNGKLYVFHHDGSTMEGWPIYTGSQGISAPAVGDIDPNYPGLEVVVAMNGLYSNWFVYAWHCDGTPIEGWPISAGQSFCSPSLADIDNDGSLEIIQFIDNLGGEEWRNGKLYVWNGDGTNVTGFPITFEGSPDSFTRGTSTAVGDIDNDGNLEIVFGLFNKQVYVFRNDGTLFSGWPITLESSEGIISSPVLGDVDNNGYLEIVCSSVGDTDNIHVFNHNGSYMPGWPKSLTWISDQSPSLCNIDNDSDLEIVLNYGIGSDHLDKTVIWHHNGSLLNGWPQNDSHPLRGQSTIGDIDGDQYCEIFSPGANNFFAWHDNGELLENFPITYDGYIEGAAAIADLENNGKMDLIAGIYAWEFPDNYETSCIEWPMFQHDAQHTGRYEKPNNNPPSAPSITGSTNGTAGNTYTYTFVTTDPDGDNVSYFIDWGDNNSSGWLGPYDSGLEKTASHSWSQKGTYTIKAKARDIYGAESDWTTLAVTMPLDLLVGQSQSLLSLLRLAFANKISLFTVILQNIQTTTHVSERSASSDAPKVIDPGSSDASTITQSTDTQITNDTESTDTNSDVEAPSKSSNIEQPVVNQNNLRTIN